MRLIIALLATTAMFVASPAGAVQVSLASVSVGGSATIDIWKNLTIELMLSDDGLTEIYGIGASGYGYAGGLSFVSGRAVRVYLRDINGVGLLNSARNAFGFTNQRVLIETAIGAFGPRVAFAQSVDVNPHTIDTAAVNSGLEVNGGVQFRLVFQGLAAGDYVLRFDGGCQGDGVVLAGGAVIQYPGAVYHVTVNPIPEPGTALLMGLGLAGLAAAGRRE